MLSILITWFLWGILFMLKPYITYKKFYKCKVPLSFSLYKYILFGALTFVPVVNLGIVICVYVIIILSNEYAFVEDLDERNKFISNVYRIIYNFGKSLNNKY